MEIKILDKGFIKLVEMMGSDQAAVDAARVSYGGVSKGEDKDKALIKYLVEHEHLSPFEHIVFKFHVKAPIFVTRQWFRHRIASYNEISYRYTEAPEEFYIPSLWRGQSTINKQASNGLAFRRQSDQHDGASASVKSHCETSLALYKDLLSKGISREMARMVLPINIYTQFYWTINARSLMNFIQLRSAEEAQFEIREYSKAIETIFNAKCPWTYEAFRKG